ncbi:MAG: DEAD/DEAH box helicase [Promethearchaeota archaeon]
MSFDEKIAKKSFIIMDRDPVHKKKILYILYVFKLEYDDPQKGVLKFNPNPIFNGMVEFEYIEEGDLFDEDDYEEDNLNMKNMITDDINDTDFKDRTDINRSGNGHLKAIPEPFRLWKRVKQTNGNGNGANSGSKKGNKGQIDFSKNYVPLNPRLFKKLFQSVKFVVLPIEQDKEKREKYEESISHIYELARRWHNVEIRRYLLCDHCRKKRVFTLLSQNNYFIAYNKRKICKDCAGREVYSLLKKDFGVEMSPEMKMLMARQLLKFRDVSKVLTIFLPNFNPLKHRELTLFDKKEASKSLLNQIRKIKLYRISELDIPDVLKAYYNNKKIYKLLPIQSMAINEGLLNNENLLVVSSTSSGKTLLGELAGFSKILESKLKKTNFNMIKNTLESLKGKARISAYKEYLNSLRRIKPRGKMLYLVPIVALASLRYEEYKELRKIGINPVLRVGKSVFEEDLNSDLGKLNKADIVIATYEALDIVLRTNGKYTLGNVETIVIDEIQMLNDPERGFILDGMISRLKFLYPKAQYLLLSATISTPKKLAAHYNCKLIEFKGRPVPMERHLIFALNDFEKHKMMLLLVSEEFKNKSKYGYKGQSLIFTNSRRKTYALAEFLRNNGVPAAAYHGGLTLKERQRIESKFNQQRLAAVITTAALAAGVDFPASQVIFESLAMGIKWLSVADFEQMSGRAGRLGKHELAKVVLLCEPGKTYHNAQAGSEEKMALILLKGKLEPLELTPDEDRMYTEVLAFISMASDYVLPNSTSARTKSHKGAIVTPTKQNKISGDLRKERYSSGNKKEQKPKSRDLIAEYVEKMRKQGKLPPKDHEGHQKNEQDIHENNKDNNNGTDLVKPQRKLTAPTLKDITNFQKTMFNANFDLKTCLKYLKDNVMINLGNYRPNGTREVAITSFGRASASGFFTVDTCVKIKKSLEEDVNYFDLDFDLDSQISELEDEFEPENNLDTDEEEENGIDKAGDKLHSHFSKKLIQPKKPQKHGGNNPDDNREENLEKGDAAEQPLYLEDLIEYNLPLEIAMELNPFNNIYVSNAVSNEIKKASRGKVNTNQLFSNSTLSLLSADLYHSKRSLSKYIIDVISVWTKEIFNCGHKDSPYCNCGRKNIERRILEYRLLGDYPQAIIKKLNKELFLKVYMGDLFDYFDSLIHNLKIIYKIGKSIEVPEEIKEDLEKIPKIIELISN